jgi:iron(III) transport system substrate-binding protein
MKKLMLAGCLALLALAAYAGGKAQPGGGADPAAARKKWAEDNGLNKTETVAELYEKAKLEGEVNVYGVTGRIADVGKNFTAKYPGVKVNFYDLTVNELAEKFSREYEAGVRVADVINTVDMVGQVYNEFIKTGMMHNYHPGDIFGDIVDRSYLAVTPFAIELQWWTYNSEVYQDLPISSWWDVTKPEWKGKIIFADPGTEPTLAALFAAVLQNPDVMAGEYQRVFGKPIELAPDEANAAYAWIKRLARNGPILETSQTGIVEAVGGAAGMKAPPLGYAVSSKLRERERQNWRLAVNPKKIPTPTSNVQLMLAQIADQAPHPNAAKLFVRYLCGEAGHQGEGLDPFKHSGGYFPFKNVTTFENQPKWEDISRFTADLDYLYNNYLDAYDYWLSVQP